MNFHILLQFLDIIDIIFTNANYFIMKLTLKIINFKKVLIK